MNSSSSNNTSLARRASGKRRRAAFNPNQWASSTLSQRTKVLILGVSYPSVAHQIQSELSSYVNLEHIYPSVEQAIELVRRNALTQMDGRDLARVLALEANNDTHCYTASLEEGANYINRHIHANFNRPTFCYDIKSRYGHDIKFRQIILDYFWIPSGTWQRSHWSSSFFQTTIPNFVRQQLLDFNPGLYKESDVNIFSTSGKGGASVYLPFCLHCLAQIIASYTEIRKYYTIHFIYKHQLDQHALWAATSTIDPIAMQNWLGKALNQEDVYCTITPKEVFESSVYPNVTRDEILNILRRINDFYDVRMIQLKALEVYNPEHSKKEQNRSKKSKRGSLTCTLGIDIGGFVGLVDNKKTVKNGFDRKDWRDCIVHNIWATRKQNNNTNTTKLPQSTLNVNDFNDEKRRNEQECHTDDKKSSEEEKKSDDHTDNDTDGSKYIEKSAEIVPIMPQSALNVDDPTNVK